MAKHSTTKRAATAKSAKKLALKTQPTKASAAAFIAAVEDESRRADAKVLDTIFREITGEKPQLWGPSIVGYGAYTYRTASGGEGRMCRTGFSPRKGNLVLYIIPGFKDHASLLKKLGKHKTGKSCLYINSLASVDEGVLRELIARTWTHMAETYP